MPENEFNAIGAPLDYVDFIIALEKDIQETKTANNQFGAQGTQGFRQLQLDALCSLSAEIRDMEAAGKFDEEPEV